MITRKDLKRIEAKLDRLLQGESQGRRKHLRPSCRELPKTVCEWQDHDYYYYMNSNGEIRKMRRL